MITVTLRLARRGLAHYAKVREVSAGLLRHASHCAWWHSVSHVLGNPNTPKSKVQVSSTLAPISSQAAHAVAAQPA
jgi:hypothetical protein